MYDYNMYSLHLNINATCTDVIYSSADALILGQTNIQIRTSMIYHICIMLHLY